MKVADFIINNFADYGIDTMFVVYGAANGDLIDAFTRTDKTKYVAVMHEQGGGFAAEVYAKVTGKPGVAIATSGPGGMNLLTSMGNCFYDSFPCIFITGQINSCRHSMAVGLQCLVARLHSLMCWSCLINPFKHRLTYLSQNQLC